MARPDCGELCPKHAGAVCGITEPSPYLREALRGFASVPTLAEHKAKGNHEHRLETGWHHWGKNGDQYSKSDNFSQWGLSGTMIPCEEADILSVKEAKEEIKKLKE